MRLIKNVISLIIMEMILNVGCVYASSGYHYEKQVMDKRVVHIVTLHPKDYKIELIKARDASIGRETVLSMAKRANAAIAINGGFFEIGNQRDGKATGTLVIKGYKYKVVDKQQSLVIISPDKFLIVRDYPRNYLTKSNTISMLSGIPLLVSENKVVPELAKKSSDFYLKPHARTAIGTKADGTIVIVVTEHQYLKDLTSISMGEVQSLIKEKGKQFAEQYNHRDAGNITMNELKEILKKEYTSRHRSQGLTILELAELMKNLGCEVALNLDGGGSSTLCVNKKVMNRVIGDADEGNGLEMTRGVSDAIVFIEK